MIVTVTPNPSIDRTLRIPPLARGQVLRAESATAEAGGKGVNVSRALAAHGEATVAVAPLSAASEASFRALLGDAAPLEVVPIAGPVRSNVSLVETDGTVTKVNEPGPELDTAAVAALLDRVAELARSADWVAGCGSLPPGASVDFYARLAGRAPAGVRVAVDADGPALAAAITGGVDLIKPNRAELEALLARRLSTLGDVIRAAAGVVAGGVLGVLVSLGSDGAVYVDAAGASHADARIDDVVNTVGAGDALLAGFLAGGANRDALAEAVAWSVAACRSPGTRMRPVSDSDRAAVRVHDTVRSGRLLAA